MAENDVILASEVLDLEAVDNAKVSILGNVNIHMVKEGALTTIEGADNLRELLRCAPEVPKSKKERRRFKEMKYRGERQKGEELTLVDDYDLGDNHGQEEEKSVRDAYGEKRWGISNIN